MRLPPLPSVGDIIRLYNLTANQKLAQNFLLDSNVTDKIVRAAGDLSKSIVIEVGPGPGSLTRSILNLGAKKVVAVEKDRRFHQALEGVQQASESKLEVVFADMLKINEAELLQHLNPEKDSVKIIANLPFNVGTQLLLKWLRLLSIKQGPFIYGSVPMILMFQSEVGSRIVAQRNSKEYSRLSIMVQRLCKAKRVFDIPGKVFVPPPKVSSSVVYLEPLETPLGVPVSIESLEYICRRVFGLRRKTLHNALKLTLGREGVDVDDLIRKSEIDPNIRPQLMSIEQYTQLAKQYELINPNIINSDITLVNNNE